ncbi:hypothetical protein ABH930_007015 [Kitasatospora sp. GAS204A]|uniref:hypothetical protein n=1 Tax=unclassified Kitasatospora TaxID=2633591 RepID=UPI0024766F3C|nr:hypothetical protein [Kitasatospora sp. GAS204B]MDH6122704.1 hypothetical protein [Kitasatospora sp. GAS204B]
MPVPTSVDELPEYARTLLLSGVPDADTVQEMNQRGEGGQIVGRVVRNIVESGFRVTERQESPNGVLNGEKLEGDCGTLTGTAVMLLRAAGFPDRKQDPEHGVGHERIGDCIVADTGARRIGGAEPNLDDGRHYFNEHYYLKHGTRDTTSSSAEPIPRIWDCTSFRPTARPGAGTSF